VTSESEEKVDRPFERYRCYYEFAEDDGGSKVGKEVKSVFERENALIAAALTWPHAIVSTGLQDGMFEVADFRFAFRCLKTLVMGQAILPGQELPKDTFAAELRRQYTRTDTYYDDARAGMWLDRVLTFGAPTLQYALNTLVPEQIARFNVKRWSPMAQGLSERLASEWRVRELHQEWRTFAKNVEAEPDGGQVGQPLSALVRKWDSHDKDNRRLIPLGFPDIDDANGGGHGRGEMMVVGGGTNHGKSYWCLQLLLNLADQHYTALHMSVEDDEELMVARTIADSSGKEPRRIRARAEDADLIDAAKERAANRLADYVYYLDTPKWPVTKICDAIRRHVYLFGVDLVIVDYLQAIEADEPTNSRANDVATIVKTLKKCAKDCQIALVITSQYDRDSYKDFSEPHVQSCKWAGEIENESEILFLLWRDEQGILRGKVAKLKWSKSMSLRFQIPVNDDTGCIDVKWNPDFTQQREERRASREARAAGASRPNGKPNGSGGGGGHGSNGV
jgi:archaellum biogenesis ATPase FlaH